MPEELHYNTDVPKGNERVSRSRVWCWGIRLWVEMEDVLGSCPLAPSPRVLSELVLYNSAEIRTANVKLNIISAQINNEEKALLCKAGKQPISTMLATSHLAGRPVRTEVWRCLLAVGPLECLHTHSEENLGCDLLCICHIGCWTSAHTSRPEERITVMMSFTAALDIVTAENGSGTPRWLNTA